MPSTPHWERLVAALRSALGTYGHSRLELEWRLGHRQGQFRPGVGADAWRRLQTALDASPAFTKSFKETVERLGDVPGMKRIDSVSGGSDSSGGGGGSTWMHKKRLADVDLDPAAASTRPWSVRASVSLEEADEAKATGGELRYERRKRRWSYRHECWSVDLTIVRSNLPSHLDDDEEAYEVEVELVDQGVLFEKTAEHVVEWGWGLVEDMMALMTSPAAAPPPPPPPPPAPKLSWADM